MSLNDDKRKIFGEIAALRVSTETYPKFKIGNSLDSLDNIKSGGVDFLTDLIKSLIGFEELQNAIADFLTNKIEDVEDEVKSSLKNSLNTLISCNINPSIPDSVKHTNIVPSSTGLNMDIKHIDYLNIFLTNPNTPEGGLIYGDTSSGINSTDCNTFLFNALQTPNYEFNWGSITNDDNNDILSVKFNPSGQPNNTLNIKVSEFYSNPTNNKKLIDLNNDYIDSITFLSPDKIISGAFDLLFGVLSGNKSEKQITQEAKLEALIDRIINSEDTIIDDSYFQFTNEELIDFENISNNRKNGVQSININDNVELSMDINDLVSLQNNINGVTSSLVLNQEIINGLSTITQNATSELNNNDAVGAKLNIFDALIKKLTTAIINIVLSPKLLLIYNLNYYIITGNEITDPLDFFSKNRNMIKGIIDSIKTVLTTYLTDIVMKQITDLVEKHLIEILKEKQKALRAQLASLTGVNQLNIL